LASILKKASHKQHIPNITAAGSSNTLFRIALTMERLLSPSTRYRDIVESLGRLEAYRSHPRGFQELNLDISTEEFLSAETAFTYTDLYTVLRNVDTVVWLTPHAAVMRESGMTFSLGLRVGLSRFYIFAEGKNIVAWSRSRAAQLEICDIVLRLLAVSVVHSASLSSWSSTSINAPTLAYLMEQCRSLKLLSLSGLEMDEDHCRVLGAYSRPGLEIELT
jgi:hypothetical protein